MTRKVYKPHLATTQDARTVRTRETMRRALLDLLETTAFDRISIRDIAATAGIGYATFFRHHPTKEALLQEIAADQMRRVIGMALPVLEMNNPRPASVALFQYIDDHRKLWSTLLTGGAAGALREELSKISAEVAAKSPFRNMWPPTEITSALVVSATIELIAQWLRQKKPMTVEQVAEIHETLIITPMTAKRSPTASKTRRK